MTDTILISKPIGALAYVVHDDEPRFKVTVTGRRVGKTGQGLRWLTKQGLKNPNPHKWEVWYIAPKLKDARRIAWKRLKIICKPVTMRDKHGRLKIHDGRMEITLINGSLMALKGADKPDDLVGSALWAALFDECGGMKSSFWDFISPSFSDTGGRAWFAGTPRGSNHFKVMYDAALAGELPGFKAYPIVKTVDSIFVPKEEIDNARKTMSPKMFRQEYEGSFENYAGVVYSDFSDGNIKDIEFDPRFRTYCCLDFGWTDACSAVWMQYNAVDDHWYILPSVFCESFIRLETFAKILQGNEVQIARGVYKCPVPKAYMKDVTYIAGVEVNQKRQEAGGRSARAQLRRFGINVIAKSHMIFDSIQSVRDYVETADGKKRLFVARRDNRKIINDFKSYHYAEKDGKIQGEIPDTSTENHEFSNTLDSVRYGIDSVTPSKKMQEAKND